jgi:hypothetical protein
LRLSAIAQETGTSLARVLLVSFIKETIMSNDYAGRSQEDRIARDKQQKQRAQEQPGGDMAKPGTAPDKDRSCGELTERGKDVWRTGSGIDGGGKT